MVKKRIHFDVCIIGASIAGNYLGYLLSESNLRIAIIEEHQSIGKPLQCAGIISQKLTDLIRIPKSLILNRVNTAKIVSPSGESVEFSGEENPYIIDRVKFDKYFYQKNQEFSNITYFLGEKFLSMKMGDENSEKVLIETSKRKISAKMIVGCDGPLSKVAKTFGVNNKLLYATQIRCEGTFDQNTAYMYFDPKWKELFGWIVPEGNNTYRIGLASAKNIATNFKIFLKKLEIHKNESISQQGGLIPYGTMNEIAFPHTLLLGDAAGQVKATTGGGIVMLLTASKYAASTINICFKQNNFSKRIIQKYYEKPCNKTIGIQLKFHYLISKVLERFDEEDFNIAFKIINREEIKNLVSIYGDMDFPKAIVFKLIRDPLVMKFGLKYLRKNLLYSVKILWNIL